MGKRKSKKKNKSRHICLKTGCVLVVALAIWGAAGEWFVHHPRSWISSQPAALSKVLCWIGNPLADVTDAFGWTGYDTICEYDTEAPSGSVFFAGAPKKSTAPPTPPKRSAYSAACRRAARALDGSPRPSVSETRRVTASCTPEVAKVTANP